jgi:glutaredoxin
MKIATASWCAPCKTLKNRIENSQIKVEYKDMNIDPDFFMQNNIRTVPTLVTDDGEVIAGAVLIAEKLGL